MKFQDKLLNIIKNEQLLKNIRSGLILALAIVLPLGYFAYAESLSIEKIFNYSFGGLVLLVWFSLQLAGKESKTRAYDDRFVVDDGLTSYKKQIEENKQSIVAKDKSLKDTTRWVSSYNKEQQDLYNEILTNDKIYDLEQRARDFRLDGKEDKAKALENEIERLKANPLVDKSFEKYDVKLIANYNTQSSGRKRKKGNAEINVNPKKTNKTFAFASLLIKSFGIGVLGSIPMVWNKGFVEIVSFYFLYLITLSLTIVVNYLITTYIMDNVYKPSLKRIIDIQELLLEHLDKVESVEIEEPDQQTEEIIPHDPFLDYIKKEA